MNTNDAYFSCDDRWGTEQAIFSTREAAVLRAMDVFEMDRAAAETFVDDARENVDVTFCSCQGGSPMWPMADSGYQCENCGAIQ